MKILNRQKVEDVVADYTVETRTKNHFRAEVKYTEDQLSELAIEFGDFLLDNEDLFDNWSRNVTTTGYCFKQFIKDKNEVNNKEQESS